MALIDAGGARAFHAAMTGTYDAPNVLVLDVAPLSGRTLRELEAHVSAAAPDFWLPSRPSMPSSTMSHRFVACDGLLAWTIELDGIDLPGEEGDSIELQAAFVR